MGLPFRGVAGTPAGAIVAALIAAGYSADEMWSELQAVNLASFLDPICPVPGLNYINAWRALGLHKGDVFQSWISQLLSRKLSAGGRLHGKPTFADLTIPLTIIATDIVKQDIKVFNKTQSLDLAIADAVRMSMSIPGIFRPVPFGSGLIIDGGVISNFPAWAFESERKTEYLPILGFRMQPEDVPAPAIKNMGSFVRSMLFTIMRAGNALQYSQIEDLWVLNLPAEGVGTLDFHISSASKTVLYMEARENARTYFRTDGRRALEAFNGAAS